VIKYIGNFYKEAYLFIKNLFTGNKKNAGVIEFSANTNNLTREHYENSTSDTGA